MKEKIIKIADHYGLDVQAVKLAEECAEYVAAMLKGLVCKKLQKYHEASKEYFSDKEVKAAEAFFKELADVLIVAKQVEYLIEKEPEVKKLVLMDMEEKLDRQLKRIEEEKENAIK